MHTPLRADALDMSASAGQNPFDLDDNKAYARWKQGKIAGYPAQARQLVVPVRQPGRLSNGEKARLLDRCGRANMAVYQLDPGRSYGKPEIAALAAQLGLRRLDCNLLADRDCITTLRHETAKAKRGYIPYSNRRINWHTDGYYNAPENRILGMLLHCEQPADSGGENVLLDHEMAYIMLRDHNPDFVRLLMQPDAMSIPANTEPGARVRGERSGPVFAVTPAGHLHMRYTARTHSIRWKENTREAARALAALLNGESPWQLKLRLGKGQGLVCNNILHTRTEFDQHAEQSRRLLYRARFLDRIEEAPK